LLRGDPDSWRGRPVFLYGFDDLTVEQRELVAALAGATEVTVSLTDPGDLTLVIAGEPVRLTHEASVTLPRAHRQPLLPRPPQPAGRAPLGRP